MARRSRPRQTLHGVVRNEIYFCRKPSCMFREKMRLIGTVIHACDQNVFEGDPLFLVADVVVTRGKQHLDLVLAINWHDLIAYASVAPCKETASRICNGSAARFRI